MIQEACAVYPVTPIEPPRLAPEYMALVRKMAFLLSAGDPEHMDATAQDALSAFAALAWYAQTHPDEPACKVRLVGHILKMEMAVMLAMWQGMETVN